MKNYFSNLISGKFGSILLVILVIALMCGLSWSIVSGFVWLICLCFGIQFNFLISTGIWLILLLLNLVFGKSSSSK